jgi:hypothetical protein
MSTEVPEKNIRHHSFGAFMGTFLLVQITFAILWRAITRSAFGEKRCGWSHTVRSLETD